MAEPQKIIIDTDPGQDDALAILLAAASEELEILGICAVAGNVPLELTESNARRLCELAGRPDIPVYAGCARPMVKDLVTAENVHGSTGLDGSALPPPRISKRLAHGVDWLVDTLMTAEPSSITLCTLGPLTNIAMALVKAPQIKSRIDQIVMMGGGFFEGGNVTPAAEFNIFVDPHAAHVVLSSGIKIVMMPLDVTHKAITTPKRLASFSRIDSDVGRACHGMLSFYHRHDIEKYGQEGGPLHDPCVIAYLLRPNIFSGKNVHVQVVTDSGPTLGMTVADWWGVTKATPNCLVMNNVNADAYYKLLVARISKLPINANADDENADDDQQPITPA